MSEPMSSGEIEDVLSSIRRLVSEDLRPAPKVAGPKPAAAVEASGKLLLTPALRVVSTQDNAPPAAPKVEAPVEAAPDVAEAPFEFANDDIDDEAEGASRFEDAPEVRAAQAEDEDWLPETTDEAEAYPGWATPEPEPEPELGPEAASAPDITRVVSDIAAGVSEADEDWEPETGDSPMAGISWQAPEWVEEAELVHEASAAEAAARDVADQAEEAAVAEIMARAAQAKAKADAAAKAKPASEPEPQSEPQDKDDIFAEDEGYFDETVLRDLVRDLIREELSGTLGERITRNVRKLVRAEINRAMTARDFE